MDDNEMVAELRLKAENIARARVWMADMGVSLVPAFIADRFPDMEQKLHDKGELELGVLAVAADLIEGTYEGNPIDHAKLAAMLRKSAEGEDDSALRLDSEADDKKEEEELRMLGMLDDEEEDEDSDREEELREYADSAREDAKFYREVADRIEAAKQ
jgi:hypothetical protein